MTTWIQSLSWTLIYSLGQGFAVYALLWLALKLVPARSANTRYHLSLSALTVLLGWFAATWWHQFHLLSAYHSYGSTTKDTGSIWVDVQRVSLSTGIDAHSIRSSINSLFPWMCALYVAGFALMLARLSAGMLQLFNLRSSGTFAPGTALGEAFETQKQQMHVHVAVKLLISAKAKVPMVIGFLKPVVLLPVSAITQLKPEQIETILLHELAHIRRNDYLVNILQTVVETVLFFNPFVWMISGIARREREHCCDDLVIGNTSEPLHYATALAILASRKTVTPPMAVAASGGGAHLYDRIQRIMEVRKNQFSYSRMVATLIIIATIAFSAAWIKPSFTGKKNKTAAAKRTTINTSESEGRATEKNEDVPRVEKDKNTRLVQGAKKSAAPKEYPEQKILIQRLIDDKVIDQVKGFLVEKRDDKLIINGEQVPASVANKYLSGLKSKTMYMQVYRLEDRLRMHPNADLLQLLLPCTLESPCVDTKPKDGC